MNNTGFINGYRWGVEYPTNGSKPDLPDDVIIQLSVPMCGGALSVFASPGMCAAKGATFKITDERYKPEDTSYLDSEESYNDGAEHFEWIANQFDNVDDANAVWALRDKLFHKRKAEAERRRIMDAACKYLGIHLLDTFQDLYDAGFLRMPEGQ